MNESELKKKIFILSEKYNEYTKSSIESIKNEEEIEYQTINLNIDYMLNQK